MGPPSLVSAVRGDLRGWRRRDTRADGQIKMSSSVVICRRQKRRAVIRVSGVNDVELRLRGFPTGSRGGARGSGRSSSVPARDPAADPLSSASRGADDRSVAVPGSVLGQLRDAGFLGGRGATSSRVRERRLSRRRRCRTMNVRRLPWGRTKRVNRRSALRLEGVRGRNTGGGGSGRGTRRRTCVGRNQTRGRRRRQ